MKSNAPHWFPRARRVLVVSLLVLGSTVLPAGAQATQSEAEVLAQGWNTLVRGDLEQARAVAARLRGAPGTARSVAALAFMVEVALRSGGPDAGLNTYEEWLGKRSLESGYTLRPIALAILRAAAEGPAGRARTEARQALAADGDEKAAAAVATAIQSGDPTEVTVGAAQGNRAAVERLVAEISNNPNVRVTSIEALGASGDPTAVRAVVPLLTSDRDEILVASARALGRAGVADAAASLRRLLDDPRFHVKFAAAEALFKLGDESGRPMLQQALASPHASIRASAAEAMASNPPPTWTTTVQALSRDADPQVRTTAARLLADQDPEAAAAVFSELMQDPNPAVRELAGVIQSEQETRELSRLRKLLRSPDLLVKVRAAANILRLTR